MRPSSLVRRLAKPEEVANLVVFLAGEGSSATTGAALRVDGGVVRSIVQALTFSNGRDEPAAKGAKDHHGPRRRLPDEEQEEGREGKREVAPRR